MSFEYEYNAENDEEPGKDSELGYLSSTAPQCYLQNPGARIQHWKFNMQKESRFSLPFGFKITRSQ